MGSLFDLALRLTCDLSNAIKRKRDFSTPKHHLVCQSMRDLAGSLMFRSEFDGSNVSQGCEEIWTEHLHVLPV